MSEEVKRGFKQIDFRDFLNIVISLLGVIFRPLRLVVIFVLYIAYAEARTASRMKESAEGGGDSDA